MITRLKALRSLRWNYKRRGVWTWLKGRQCFTCGGKGNVLRTLPRSAFRNHLISTCPACNGSPKRGYQRILSEPETVISEQTAIAEGGHGLDAYSGPG